VIGRVERVGRRSESLAATTPRTASSTTASVDEMAAAMQRVRESRNRLDRLQDRPSAQRARIVALLASADKRESALEYETLKMVPGQVLPAPLDARVWPLLARARMLYDEAFSLNPAEYWVVVQYLSLTLVLRHAGRPQPCGRAVEAQAHLGKLWALAEVQSLRDLSGDGHAQRAWALGNLIELYMLAPVTKEVLKMHAGQSLPQGHWLALALRYARDLARMARPGAFEVFSTRRQVLRYLDLYMELCPPGVLEEAVKIAVEVAGVLPGQLLDDHQYNRRVL
jgi:hypothetical protein